MEELLDMLDAKIFTPEVKEQIIAAFNDAVDKKVEIKLAEEKADNEETETEPELEYEGEEEVLNDMSKAEIVAKANDYVAEEVERVTNILEKHYAGEIIKLANEAEKYAEYIKASLISEGDNYAKYVAGNLENRVNEYLDTIVDDIVNETLAKRSETNVDAAKLNALLEGFNSMLVTGGVYLKDINEASEGKPEIEAELNKMISENMKLKKELASFTKQGIISEAVKDLTVPQKETVQKIAKHLRFISESDFKSKVSSVVSDVVVTGKVVPETMPTSTLRKSNTLNENVIEDSHKHLF